jgi:hypothetical protein
MMGHNGIVYLLHFERSHRHARHYIGFTQNLEQRLAEHRAGRESPPLITEAIADGIDFQLAAIWDGDRHDEPRLHRQKNTRARLCPICITDPRVGIKAPVDLVDEPLLSVLGGIPQPATLTAVQAQLVGGGSGSGAFTAASNSSPCKAASRSRGCSARSPGKPRPAPTRTTPHRCRAPGLGMTRTGRWSVPSQGSRPGGRVGVGERPRHPGRARTRKGTPDEHRVPTQSPQ